MSDTKEFFAEVGTNVVIPRDTSPSMTASSRVTGSDNPSADSKAADDATEWSASGDKFFGSSRSHPTLPAGCYRTAYSDGIGFHMLKQRVVTDGLMRLPDDASASILAEFQEFWRIKTRFTSRGFLHKRGFLLYGPPGSGKTSLIHQMSRELIDGGDVVLLLSSAFTAEGCLQLLRKIEPARPVVAIAEDFDSLISHPGEVSGWLALLDGESNIDNCVFVATTNYPSRIDSRFVDRPSRFDTIRRIGMPSAAARRVYLATKEPSLTEVELTLWVAATEGYSVAHLKELIIAVKCFGQPFADVIERLNDMRESRPNEEHDPARRAVGMLPFRKAS